jgi:hypothetical protein
MMVSKDDLSMIPGSLQGCTGCGAEPSSGGDWITKRFDHEEMGNSTGLIDYPLVNVYITMERSTIFNG